MCAIEQTSYSKIRGGVLILSKYLKNHLKRGGFFYFTAGVAEWVAREGVSEIVFKKTE
jgi:hypothetical protein